jgi:NAD(P)-dependent dehydrogenase (short-subunit alcohol dehydrogenase family)
MGYTSGTLKGLVGEELERYKQQVLTANPMGIVTEPEDIAAAVEFLASHRARLITGAVLPVDGGLLASRPFAKWPGPTK